MPNKFLYVFSTDLFDILWTFLDVLTNRNNIKDSRISGASSHNCDIQTWLMDSVADQNTHIWCLMARAVGRYEYTISW